MGESGLVIFPMFSPNTAIQATMTRMLPWGMNWIAWHLDYACNDERAARLEIVRKFIDHGVGATAPGGVVLVSVCAGDSRDVLGVLPNHRRRDDVHAWLLEREETLTREAARRVVELDLDKTVCACAVDATCFAAYAGIPPANVCVLSGVFGNLLPEESFRLIRNLKHVCAPGASVIWTRNLVGHDGARHAEQLRACFEENRFAEEVYLKTPREGYGVGLTRFEGETVAPDREGRFFVFGRE